MTPNAKKSERSQNNYEKRNKLWMIGKGTQEEKQNETLHSPYVRIHTHTHEWQIDKTIIHLHTNQYEKKLRIKQNTCLCPISKYACILERGTKRCKVSRLFFLLFKMPGTYKCSAWSAHSKSKDSEDCVNISISWIFRAQCTMI